MNHTDTTINESGEEPRKWAGVLNNKKFIEQEFYRFIFENSMDAIFLTSPDGAIHRANPAACRMFEMTEEELVKAGRAGIVDPKDPRLAAGLKEREEKGFVFAELTYIKKTGPVFPARSLPPYSMMKTGRNGRP